MHVSGNIEQAFCTCRPTPAPTLTPTRAPTSTYVLGGWDTNECPAGSVRIETEAACRTAAAATGKTFTSVVDWSTLMRGCFYWNGNNQAHYNTHAVGAVHHDAHLICGAPSTPLRARACSGTICTYVHT
jgi:hypothetical protein